MNLALVASQKGVHDFLPYEIYQLSAQTERLVWEATQYYGVVLEYIDP